MLLQIISVNSYVSAEDFLTSGAGGPEHKERHASFNKLYPVDDKLDVVVDGVEESWVWRLERYVDDLGDTTVIAKILADLNGSYLMDIRSNAHESNYIVTCVAI